MNNTCQYVWKTTQRKGQRCGRKLLKSDSPYCFQHKPIVKKEILEELAKDKDIELSDDSIEATVIVETSNSKKMPVIQLTNTPDKKNTKKPEKEKTKKVISSSSDSSSSSILSSSSDSSSD